MTQWTITVDHIAGEIEPGGAGNAVGLVGPRGATLTHKQIINHPEGKRFRMLDDDGILYYEGFLIGDECTDRDLTASTGNSLARWRALRSLSTPSCVNRKALRAFRVGITQSNMSMPRATAARMSSGVPTPIR